MAFAGEDTVLSKCLLKKSEHLEFLKENRIKTGNSSTVALGWVIPVVITIFMQVQFNIANTNLLFLTKLLKRPFNNFVRNLFLSALVSLEEWYF